jgi:hypothetical protein
VGFLAAEGRGRPPRRRQEHVAGEDRDGVAPPRVDAGPTPTRLGLVDHVVVVERPQVQQLHGGGRGDHPVARRSGIDMTSCMPGRQRQQGSQPLAAGGNQISGGLGERRVPGLHRGTQELLDTRQLVGNRLDADAACKLRS